MLDAAAADRAWPAWITPRRGRTPGLACWAAGYTGFVGCSCTCEERLVLFVFLKYTRYVVAFMGQTEHTVTVSWHWCAR